MNKEVYPSLFITKLSVIILAIVFVSGVVEFACLAYYAHKANHSVANETVNSISRPLNMGHGNAKSSMLILSPKLNQ